MLRSLCRVAVSSLFAAIFTYSAFMSLEIVNVAVAGACRDCALVVVPRAFSHMVVTFRGKRKGNLVFWWSKADFS